MSAQSTAFGSVLTRFASPSYINYTPNHKDTPTTWKVFRCTGEKTHSLKVKTNHDEFPLYFQ